MSRLLCLSTQHYIGIVVLSNDPTEAPSSWILCGPYIN